MLNSRDPALLLPFVEALWYGFAEQLDTRVAAGVLPHYVLAQTMRDVEYQNYLYAQGRTRAGVIVTNAKGGRSYHHYGVAVDVLLLTGKSILPDRDPAWDALGALGQECGFDWGGVCIPGLVDKPHFQYTAGITIDQFKTGWTIDEDGNAVAPG
jgi:hypothetical protein